MSEGERVRERKGERERERGREGEREGIGDRSSLLFHRCYPKTG